MRRGVIVSVVVATAVLVASTGVQATTPTWKVQQTPNPAGATASLLSGLSCVSATVCTAAGHYTNISGNEAMFVEHVSSNTWAVQKLATPSDPEQHHSPGAVSAPVQHASDQAANSQERHDAKQR